MIQAIVHYGIHFLLPLFIALVWFKNNWLKAYLIMMSAFIIDLDHLLASPIFAPNRCSINFHPLHSYVAIGCYIFLLFPKKTRLLGLGLVSHIVADTTDCFLMQF
ncbi:DUF6122 family protein [Corallibacter sp.]|uniref:DUF6122 family protein n=1 Tax=Corallibacter sp. TaxID=2038084 RepID=UPI003AB515CB